MKEYLFLDGNPVKTQFPLRPVFFGDGIFETFRCRGNLPVYLEKHLNRMQRGAEILSIPLPSKETIVKYIESAYRFSGISDANLKICILTRGGHSFHDKPEGCSVLTTVREISLSGDSVRICASSHRRNSTSVLNTIKSLNYLEQILVKREAVEKGFDDAVILNHNDEITESSSCNIFWVRGKGVYTPSTACGLLPGITRELVLGIFEELGFQIHERKFGLSYMMNSDFIFLTNSVAGMLYVEAINELKMPEMNDKFTEIRHELHRKLKWL